MSTARSAAKLAIDVPDVKLDTTVSVRLNTTKATQGSLTAGQVDVLVSGADLVVGGQTLHVDTLTVSSSGTGPAREVLLTVAGLRLTIGPVTISGANGAFHIAGGTLAGLASGTVSVVAGSSFGLAGAATFQINTGTTEVTIPDPADPSATKTLPAGPFLRVSIGNGSNPVLTVGTLGFAGTVLVERSTRTGYGTLTATLATVQGTSVATGDLNGDGITDLVVGVKYATGGSASPGGYAVYLGGSTSTTLTPATGTLVPQPTGTFDTADVAVADLDNDGYPDLVLVGSGQTLVLRNKGISSGTTPTWQGLAAAGTAATTATATAVAVGDVNGDGFADVVVTSSANGTKIVQTTRSVSVATGTAVYTLTGLAAPSDTLGSGTTDTTNGNDVALADLNSDGRLDIVLASSTGDRYLLNSTTKTSSTGSPTTVNTGPTTTTDAPGTTWNPQTGTAPVKPTDTTVTTTVTTPASSGTGTTTITRTTVETTTTTTYAQTTVSNSATSSTTTLSTTVSTRKVTTVSTDTYTLGFAAPVVIADGSSSGRLVTGDLNGDGEVDVAATPAASGAPVVYWNRGVSGSTWAGLIKETLLGTGVVATGLTLADVSADGRADLVVTSAAGTRSYAAQPCTAGRSCFAAPETVSTTAVGAADLTTAVAVLGGVVDVIGVGANGVHLYQPTARTRTVLGLAGITIDFGDAKIQNGQGALVVLSDGIAGTFSGTFAAGSSSGSVNVSAAVRFNSSTQTLDEIVDVEGTAVALHFGADETFGHPTAGKAFHQVSGSGTILIGGFIELTATFSGSTITGGTIFVGNGPSRLEDGSPNPDARGVSLTGLTGTWDGTTLSADGTVTLVGVPGVTLTGTIHASGTKTGTDGQFIGTNLVLNVDGLALTGTFAVTKSAGNLILTLTTVALDLGTGTTPPVHVSIPTGTITVSPAGVVADVAADVTLNIPGQTAQTLGGRIQLNTTGATALSIAPGTTRVLVTGNLSVAGQSLSGTFGFEQTLIQPAPGAAPGATPTKEVRVFASEVGLTLGTTDSSDNLTSGVRLRHGVGALVLTASGMAGTFTGDVSIVVPGATVVGSVSLALNTGTTAVNTTVDLGAGPVTVNVPAGTTSAAYLKFTGTGLVLDLAGQKITADVTVEKGATAGTTTLTLSNVGATFGDGTNPVVVLSGGNAAFTITTAGTYGVITGHLTVNIPSVTITGTLLLALNTTTGSQSVTWTDPVTTTTNTVSVAKGILFVGRDLHLLIGGTDLAVQELRLTQASDATGAKTTTFGLTNASLTLAGVGSVTVNGNLVASPLGVAGRLSLSTGLTFGSAASLTGTLALTTNSGAQAVSVGGVTIPAGPYLRIDGSGTLTVGDLSIAGAFTVERATSSTGATRTVLGLTGGQVSLGGSLLVTGVQGALVVIPGATGGLAASLRGTVDLSSVLPSSVQVGGTFAVAINQTSSRVAENVTVGDTVVVLDLVAGPYVSVSATGAVLSIAGQTLSGDLSFTRAMDGTTPRTVLAVNHLALSLGGGAVTLSEGHGVLVITGSGSTGTLAGKLTGTIAVTAPGVSVSGTVALEINTAASGTAAIPALVLGSETLPSASVPAGLRVTVTGARLQVAGQRLDVASVVFTQTGSAASRVVTVSVTNARLFLGTPGPVDADPSSGGTGLQVELSNGELVMTTSGLAGSFTGGITLVGITGISFSSGTISLRLNTGTAAVTLPSSTVIPAGSFLRLELGTTQAPLTLTVGDSASPFVTLRGAFAVQKAPTPGTDGILGTADDGSGLQLAATEVSIFVGDQAGTLTDRSDDTGLWLDHGTVLLLLGGSGLAGHISASAALYLGSGPVASVDSAVLDLNQRATAVDEQISVGGTTQRLVLPKGPYLHVALIGAQVAFGGFSFSTDVSVTKQNVTTTSSGGTTTTAMTTTFSFAHLSLAIGQAGRPVVQVSNGHGDLVIGAGGVHGDVAVDLAVLVPGVTLTGTFALTLDTRAASRGITVSATGVTLGVGGQTLTGSFIVKQDGTTREVLLLPNLRLNLGDGTETFVSVGVSGPILLTPTGVALDVTATLTLGPALAARLGDKLSFGSGLAVQVLVNTTGSAVNRTGTLAGQPLSLVVPSGSAASPYVRVQTPTGQTTTITVMGQTVSGVFTFEQTGAGTARVVRIGLTSTEVHLGTGTDASRLGVDVTAGSGALLITSGGVAGGFQGTVSLTPALASQLGVSASGTVRVLVNTLTTASTTTIGGSPVALPAGPYLRVEVNNLAIAFGAVSETYNTVAYREYQLSGSFLFQQASATYTPTGGTPTTSSVLTIAMAGLQLGRRNTSTHAYEAVGVSGLSGVVEINPRGAGGWALSIAADISANVGPLKAGGRLVGTYSTAPRGPRRHHRRQRHAGPTDQRGAGAPRPRRSRSGSRTRSSTSVASSRSRATSPSTATATSAPPTSPSSSARAPTAEPGAIGVAITNASVQLPQVRRHAPTSSRSPARSPWSGSTACGSAAPPTLEVNTGTTDCARYHRLDPCGGVAASSAQTFSLLRHRPAPRRPGVLDISGPSRWPASPTAPSTW